MDEADDEISRSQTIGDGVESGDLKDDSNSVDGDDDNAKPPSALDDHIDDENDDDDDDDDHEDDLVENVDPLRNSPVRLEGMILTKTVRLLAFHV